MRGAATVSLLALRDRYHAVTEIGSTVAWGRVARPSFVPDYRHSDRNSLPAPPRRPITRGLRRRNFRLRGEGCSLGLVLFCALIPALRARMPCKARATSSEMSRAGSSLPLLRATGFPSRLPSSRKFWATSRVEHRARPSGKDFKMWRLMKRSANAPIKRFSRTIYLFSPISDSFHPRRHPTRFDGGGLGSAGGQNHLLRRATRG